MNKEAFAALLTALLAGNLSADNLTREQLDKLLTALAEKPAPEAKVMVHAMCYDMAAPPKRFEYVCPKCGEKTIYSRDAKATDGNPFAGWEAMLAVQSLHYHRGELFKLRKLGIDASFDERAFCSACKKNAEFADEKLTVYLVVRLDDKTATTPLQKNDWVKLFAFLEGKDEWVTDSITGATEPLKPELPRIRALLGLEEKATEEEAAP